MSAHNVPFAKAKIYRKGNDWQEIWTAAAEIRAKEADYKETSEPMPQPQTNYPRAKSVPPLKHALATPYEFQPFPSFRFHPDGRKHIVRSEEESAALGEEWRSEPFPKFSDTPEVQREIVQATREQLEQAVKEAADEHCRMEKRLSEMRSALGKARDEHRLALEAKDAEIAELRAQIARLTADPNKEPETPQAEAKPAAAAGSAKASRR